MISETSEEQIATAPTSAAKPSRQSSKTRKLNARTFDFFWKRDSRRESVPKKEESRKEDLVEIKIVDSNAKNVLPNRTSLDFFKNIKKHVQIKKLTIRRSKRKTKELEVPSQQSDSNSDALADEKHISAISTEGSNMPELMRENAVDTSDVANSNGILNDTEVWQNECSSESLEETIENRLDAEEKLDTINAQTPGNIEVDNANPTNVPNVRQLYTTNEIRQLQFMPVAENIVTDQVGNIEENTEANINNSNKAKASLAKELLKLSNYGWYWGPISGNEADAKLVSEPDGAFLVRDSSDDRYVLTLSFKSSGKLLHARMEYSGGLFSLCNQSEREGFSSVADLIDYSVNFSQSAVFCYSRPKYPGHPSFPVRLTKPVSRFTQVRSLQYLCRFVIRQNTRLDNIHKLPLPKTIKVYIEEAHY